MIVTGAGISCSAGIPDFRSKAGLYNLLKAKNPGTVVRGQDLFDANLFRSPEATGIFYRFMGEFKDMIGNCKYTKTHSFIKRIHDSDKLLRCYTQNIDDLEVGLTLKTNLEPNPQHAQVVQLHGSMSRVVCTRAPMQHSYDFSSEFVAGFKNGEAPDCPACIDIQQQRASSGKRTNSSGTLRPDIVLYNEPHPMGEVIGKLQCHDLRKRPDFLLIMGTSLKIPGCKKLVKEAAKIVHNFKHGKVVFVNLSDVGSSEWDGVIDYHFQCKTDSWVDKVESLFLKFYKPKAAPRTLPRSASATILRKPDILDIEPYSSPLLTSSPSPSLTLNLNSDQINLLDPESSPLSGQSPGFHSLATPTKLPPMARTVLPRSSSARPSLSRGRSFSRSIRPIEDLDYDSASTRASDYSTDDELYSNVDVIAQDAKPLILTPTASNLQKERVIIDIETPFQVKRRSRIMHNANKASLATSLPKEAGKGPSKGSRLGKRLIPPKADRPGARPVQTQAPVKLKPLTKVTPLKTNPTSTDVPQKANPSTVITQTSKSRAPTRNKTISNVSTSTYSLRPRKLLKTDEKAPVKTAVRATARRA
ncbi:NAD-dependent deacetylase hst3, variant 2 [Entomophthora muscae]|uniref:NAD-dependent deacetylase hst3, variant 2 n=2 Tax=Entomophthora muscae TaxID=34485 RepID=A0ACC2SEY2_9FUNG|nr:NAD-dependent deacetylase hst3, variant 2 [Entomophthora muscae]